MIKFFRNIRKNLLNEGKTSKYLKYAIGEIVLVVIGILIALQINNWNEDRIERKEEQKIISNLNNEFEANLKALDSIINRLNSGMASMEKVFNLIGQDTSHYSNYSIDSLIQQTLISPTWRPSEFVLNDLKSSGGFSKLENNNLKKLLFKWSRFYNEIQETQTQVETTSLSLIQFIKEHGSLRNIDTHDSLFK